MVTVRMPVRTKPVRLNPVGLNAAGLNAEGANGLGGQRRSAEPRAARRLLRYLADDEGAATAEYAVATMAAVGFAGLLIVILRGDEVKGILTDLVRNALTVG